MINEPFAVAFSGVEDLSYEGDKWTRGAEDKFRGSFSEADLGAEEVQFEVGSTGYGADGLLVVGVLTGLASLFLSGKKIEENLDAWARLGRRFRKLIESLNSRWGRTSVSQPIALALALERIAAENSNVHGVSVIAAHTIPVANGSLHPKYWNEFRSQPDRVYVFLLRAVNHDTYIVGIRSDGDWQFLHRIPTGDYLEYFGVTSGSEE
jgi:hypothetical protein